MSNAKRFELSEDNHEKTRPQTMTKNEGILESIIKSPLKAARGIKDYLLEDQEYEGRKGGTCCASREFEPILSKIKKRYEILDHNIKQLGTDYESQLNIIKNEVIQYNTDSKKLICEIENKQKDSPLVKEYLKKIGYSTTAAGVSGIARIATAGIARIATAGIARIPGVPGVASLASPLGGIYVLGLVLDKRNNDKFLKYFNIEYEKTAKQYQSKIDREKNNIHQIIERIKILKNDDSLDWLDQVLLDAIQDNVALTSICTTVSELSSIDKSGIIGQEETDSYTKIEDDINEGLSRTNELIKFAEDTPVFLQKQEEDFKEQIALNKHEWFIMMTVLGLQLLRQHLLTRFPERVDDQTASKQSGKSKEHSDRHHRYYNPSLEEIITNPVPFDAIIGSNGRLAGGGKLGHRSKTLGHDPLFGLVFGTANIATSTLTTNDFSSYHIKTDNKRDVFGNNASTILVLRHTLHKLFYEGIEGKKKVGCAFIKEIIHLKSDINSTNSLPLPAISSLGERGPEFASKLAEYGFDFGNVFTVTKQASYAYLINSLAAMYHYMFYDGSIDEKFYRIKTKIILNYANTVASGINLAEVAITEKWDLLDVGGIAYTIYSLITDVKFIRKVRRDFILGNYNNALAKL